MLQNLKMMLLFLHKRFDAKAIVDSLQVDDQIRDFLIKVSSKTATLLDLNKAVLDWITKHKLKVELRSLFDILKCNWYSKNASSKKGAFFVIRAGFL